MSRLVLRFAPSPNGFLHLGHALSALLNADLAAALGGRLLLRIEDIDPVRSRAAYERAIAEDLAWLGLRFETPVRRQSEHLAEHAAALEKLKRGDLVYPCFCSRGAIRATALGAARATGLPWPSDPDGAPLYPGTCRRLSLAERARRAASGEAPVWRLYMERALAAAGAPLRWREIGETGAEESVAADPAAWGDVVLARRDVPTSYHLAVVIDDAAQGVSHVVRGRDLLAATSVHRLLQRLLELPQPVYRHHRLILGEDGRKLSKSGGATALRAAGASPADIRRLVGL